MPAIAHQANTTEASHCAALAERVPTVLRALLEVQQFNRDAWREHAERLDPTPPTRPANSEWWPRAL
jgi:hypothetical protein